MAESQQQRFEDKLNERRRVMSLARSAWWWAFGGSLLSAASFGIYADSVVVAAGVFMGLQALIDGVRAEILRGLKQ